MGRNNNKGNTTIINKVKVKITYHSGSKKLEINSPQEEPTPPAKPVENKKDKLPWYQFWFTFLQWLLPYIPALAKFLKHPT